MAKVTLHEKPVTTVGELPQVGAKAPAFTLVGKDLGDVSLADYAGRTVVLNIFPRMDTSVCAESVRRFNAEASEFGKAAVLCVSMDLPFAQERFCGSEGLKNVVTLSAFRSPTFASEYGVGLTDGPIAGLLTRAVVVIDAEGVVRYAELVPEITQEPDYAAAIASMP